MHYYTPFVLPFSASQDVGLVGGKAANLSKLVAAGFPVPEGFTVTSQAFRWAAGRGRKEVAEELASRVLEHYREMGSPIVAVRSSATAEDMKEASMAGQYETILNVQGEKEVVEAIERCWRSLDTPRTRAYLAEKGIRIEDVAMAVVVQKLVTADVAGVLFTANPRNGLVEEMVVDASYGLGESVVSGSVQPDSLILDRKTGAILRSVIGSKENMLLGGEHEVVPVPQEFRERPCLNAWQVKELWRLGNQVAAHFGTEQDIEWAIEGNGLYLLQSRAITTLSEAAAHTDVIRETKAKLRKEKEEGRGDWVLHNLAETLPHPTPLTWSVIGKFMSGEGGFGEMYRQAGYNPSEAVATEGFLTLVAGKIFMDLKRAPEMFMPGFPFRYDVELLRANPDASQMAPTLPFGSLPERMRAAGLAKRAQKQLNLLSEDLDVRLTDQIIPEFTKWVQSEKRRNLTDLSNSEWQEIWKERERKVLHEFAPLSLLPGLICGSAMSDLRQFCAEHFWDEDPSSLANLLSGGAAPDQTILAAEGLFQIANENCDATEWLLKFGHRAPEEFDLATPRWRERPDAVFAMAAHTLGQESPLHRHARRVSESEECLLKLRNTLSQRDCRELRRKISLVRRYLKFREDGKFYLMMGYELLREMALDAGRRLDIGEDVFLLREEQLVAALESRYAPLTEIEIAKKIRRGESRITLPRLITEAEIPTLGESHAFAEGDRFSAFSISSGVASGSVRIVTTPTEAGELGRGYILVCSSTDPNWTPLFAGAAGLIIERGGTLSHGAVVAREMGLPAVVLDGATQLLNEGEEIVLDGNHGVIVRAGASQTPEAKNEAEGIPFTEIPPPVGKRERSASSMRNLFLLFWGAYLICAFTLPPSWLYEPSLKFLDFIIWPLVETFGKPASVAVVAAALAILSMVGQKILTDNHRLLEAKRRATLLRKRAAKLPEDSKAKKQMLLLAGGVQSRVVGASFVPLACLLGPMVLAFSWFPVRMDPASWNSRPGVQVAVTAKVDGEFLGEVSIGLDPALRLAPQSKPVVTMPPIRPTLEKLLSKWSKSNELPPETPWELVAAASKARYEIFEDLKVFLAQPLPEREVGWVVATPEVAGSYNVNISAGKNHFLSTPLILGDAFPPQAKEDLGDKKGPVQVARATDASNPVKLVRVVYLEPKVKGGEVFFQPFRAWGIDWSFGWLFVYIGAYVPIMFILKWLLRIP